MKERPDSESIFAGRFPVLKRFHELTDLWGGATAPRTPVSRVLLGLYWVFLLGLVYAFSGHASKFFYIDF